MDRALTAAAAALAGVLLLGVPCPAQTHRVFLTEDSRYQPEGAPLDEKTAELAFSLCGARCNTLSSDYWSYGMTMGWRLTRVEGVTERIVELANPFLGGKCVCTGQEFVAELVYYLPDGPPPPPGAVVPGKKEGSKGGAR